MSTYSLGASQALGGSQALTSSNTGTPILADQPRLLESALAIVKQQGFLMRKSIDSDQLYDALKHASSMLAELRTSSLLPKYYYELYMAVFDELRHLSNYLYDAHNSGAHHLSHLYELVQYATSIIPRIYLMITVGSVYMRVSNEKFNAAAVAAGTSTAGTVSSTKDPSVMSMDGGLESSGESFLPLAPAKEIMKDMLEMSRGVQHATRGLFVRYYMSGQTRNYLPDCKEGDGGNIDDSIDFILNNFVEMNKLWVRLQHQGHSRDRDRREQERRELRLLVGSNLVRLSQLEETTLEMYQNVILPSLLEEIVSCRDVIAQEYLLDIIIQAFPDEFHISCLDMYLAAVARLHPMVNAKNIVISLIDRFAGYAMRAREEQATPTHQDAAISAIPDDLFDVFWEQIGELIEARPEFTIEDLIALYSSLNGLALNCYPDRLEYVDRVLGMAKTKLLEGLQNDRNVIELGNTKKHLVQLLLSPINAYCQNILTIIQFPSGSSSPILDGYSKSQTIGGHFTDLLFLLSFGARREIAHCAAKAAIKANTESKFIISSVDGVNFILGEVCSIMVRDQIDGNLFGSKRKFESNDFKDEKEGPFDWEDAIEEQTLMAQLVHLFVTANYNYQQEFLMLCTARDHFKESGDIRIRFTFEPLVSSLIKIARNMRKLRDRRGEIETILTTALGAIQTLGKAREYFSEDDNFSPLHNEEISLNQSAVKIGKGLLSPAELSLKLALMGALAADHIGLEEICYEFFVEAFTIYEESIFESRAQANAIFQIISSLHKVSVFGMENGETLIEKCALYSARLLRRSDQSRAVMQTSKLFWREEQNLPDGSKSIYRNSSRALECLQKSLKIADSVMDRSISVGLFVEILEQYLWFFEKKNELITSNFINSLIELVSTNLENPAKPAPFVTTSLGGPLGAPPRPPVNFSKRLAEAAAKHFLNILHYIQSKHEEGRRSLTSTIPGMDSGFHTEGGGVGGRWGLVLIPDFDLNHIISTS